MKRVLKNVRSLRFGLRFQLSVLLFLPILAISLLLSLSIFKQNEANILNEIIRFSGAILKGGYSHAEDYLSNDRIVRNSRRSGISEYQTETHRRRRSEGLDELVAFFPAIIGKESLLDQAFLININEQGGEDQITDEKDTRFIYFGRNRAGVSEYNKSDDVLKSLYDEFMHTVSTGSRLVYADTPPQTEDQNETGDTVKTDKLDKNGKNQKYVVVGVPVFNDKEAERLYSSYQEFRDLLGESAKNGKAQAQESKDISEKQSTFEYAFLSRLVKNYTDVNYLIHVDEKDVKENLYNYLISYQFSIRRLTANQKAYLKEEFLENLTSRGGKFTLNDYLEIADLLRKKYNLVQNPDIPWIRTHLFSFLHRKKITTSSLLPLEKLARSAYRSDLDGILGVYLLRSEFYSTQRANRKDIFNMAMALFIRCVILALFLPGVLIRKINLVAEGAYEIGRGNFDHSISIRGSDELGRLADIFNIMGKNLKRAREEIIEKHRMEEELKTASEIQSILLPEKLPENEALSFAAHYEAQSEAGGDYYDVISLDKNRYAFTVADVSGHGAGAGLVMAMTRTLVHCYAPELSVREMMSKLNDHLYRNTDSKYFVTMFYGIYDTLTQKMTFTSAGHTPAILLRGNKIESLAVPGVALGAISESMYDNLIKTKSLQMKSGDTFVLYTDGIVEAMNEHNQEYGEDRFAKVLENNSQKNAEEIKSALLSDLKKHTGRYLQSDDMTLLIIRVL